MNKTFAGVMAGVAITLAVLLTLLTVLALLFDPIQGGWSYVWFLLRSVLLVGFFIFSFRYFRARSR